ncbi:hypothetical protein G9464_12565 [Halostella sp. JP-L12]|uniref:hypothetical protein n=1 Tax=Halostella TaxID=1843185 RepID=UPI000EF77A0A|nr:MULTISPECIES: hypothetical protein [Halostella]NHN48420.1 hypothetical protein [Halostella sp. JP-L12]
MSRRSETAREDLSSLRRIVSGRSEYAIAAVGLAAGGAVGGTDYAAFGALFGFFLGKSLTSMLRTVSK